MQIHFYFSEKQIQVVSFLSPERWKMCLLFDCIPNAECVTTSSELFLNSFPG